MGHVIPLFMRETTGVNVFIPFIYTHPLNVALLANLAILASLAILARFTVGAGYRGRA